MKKFLVAALLTAGLASPFAHAFDFGRLVAEEVGRHTSTGQRAEPAAQVHVNSNVVVAFSPNGDATKVVVDAIEQARSQILVQAYSFTSKPILSALAEAKNRGVDVRVIADKTNDKGKYSGATYMVNHGVPVWIDDSVNIAHNKVMIFDGRSVLTGSFNFSAAAQKDNAENVLLIKDSPDLAAQYIRNWRWRLGYSHQYAGAR